MIATKKAEFGDFQTPAGLAREIAEFCQDTGETADAVFVQGFNHTQKVCEELKKQDILLWKRPCQTRRVHNE